MNGNKLVTKIISDCTWFKN